MYLSFRWVRSPVVVGFVSFLIICGIFMFRQAPDCYARESKQINLKPLELKVPLRLPADDTLFYYAYDQKIYLYFSKEKIVAKLIDSSLETRRLFMQSETSIDTTRIPEPEANRFFVFYVVPGTDIPQLLQRLKENPYVLLANPFYFLKDEPDCEMIATDEFTVKYKPEVTRSMIDSINNLNNVSIVDSVLQMPNLFLQKIVPESEKNVLAMANFYYENYPCVYSLPNFHGCGELAKPQIDTLFYYSCDNKIYLGFSEEKVAVKLYTLSPESLQEFIRSQPEINTTKMQEPAGNGFLIFYVLPGTDIEQLLQNLRTNPYVDIVNPVFFLRDEPGSDVIATDEFTVKFNPEVTRSEIEALNDSHGVVIVDSIYIPGEVHNIFLMKLTDNSDKNILGVANRYNKDPRTIYSVPNFRAELVLSSFPSDSFFTHQYNFHNTGQTGGRIDADIDAPEAWDFTKGLPDIRIVIIDVGIEPHEDLPAERLVGGIDWAGDDLNDPNNQIPDYDPSPGRCNDSTYWKDCAHGMACAGLAGATHNQIGVAGLAPNCKIQPVKIWDNYGRFPWENFCVAQAFYSTLSPSLRVYSCSWHYLTCEKNPYPEVADAIRAVLKPNNLPGAPVVFAAGNNFCECVYFPANMDSVIAVGATNKFDSPSMYTACGPELDVVAPGGETPPWFVSDIWTMDITGPWGYNYPGSGNSCSNLNYTGNFFGTSAATPQVAGLAALVTSQHEDLYPGEAPYACMEIKDIICKSADDTINPSYDDDTVWRDIQIGYGRINAFKALLAISRGDVNNNHDIDMSDVVYLANYVLKSGSPEPIPVREMGDVNCNGSINLSDVIYLSYYLQGKFPKPPICFRYKYPWN